MAPGRHWKLTETPLEKFEVDVGLLSRNHAGKNRVSPARTGATPVGVGVWGNESCNDAVPRGPTNRIWPARL